MLDAVGNDPLTRTGPGTAMGGRMRAHWFRPWRENWTNRTSGSSTGVGTPSREPDRTSR